MNKHVFCIAAISALFFSACHFGGRKIEGNGNFKSEKRNANNISRIKLEGDMNVVIENGLAAARVEADENIIPNVITETDGEWMKISTKDNVNLISTKPVTVYLSTPSINEIILTGSGNVVANGKFSNSDKMSFDVTGSGKVTIDVNTPAIEADIQGSGALHITGETRNAKVKIAGSGNYEGADLKTENADVDVAGSGDAFVFAENNLKASIAGSGNIKYKGNAAVDKHVAGSGDVSKVQ